MDDLRESLQKAENQTREKMNNLNEVLKHIKLAQHALDLEEGEELVLVEQPDPERPTMRGALIPEEPSGLEVTFKTRYEKGTLSTCIVNVLKRMGEPGDSRKIHEQLVKGVGNRIPRTVSVRCATAWCASRGASSQRRSMASTTTHFYPSRSWCDRST